jgi:hypothetical protein
MCCLAARAVLVAGGPHLDQALELWDAELEHVSYNDFDLATYIVDQLHPETSPFHDGSETDAILLMRHVHDQGFRAEGCTWQWAKQQGTRCIRAMGSKMFAEAVQELVTLGFGVVKLEKPLTYRSLQVMAK